MSQRSAGGWRAAGRTEEAWVDGVPGDGVERGEAEAKEASEAPTGDDHRKHQADGHRAAGGDGGEHQPAEGGDDEGGDGEGLGRAAKVDCADNVFDGGDARQQRGETVEGGYAVVAGRVRADGCASVGLEHRDRHPAQRALQARGVACAIQHVRPHDLRAYLHREATGEQVVGRGAERQALRVCVAGALAREATRAARRSNPAGAAALAKGQAAAGRSRRVGHVDGLPVLELPEGERVAWAEGNGQQDARRRRDQHEEQQIEQRGRAADQEPPSQSIDLEQDCVERHAEGAAARAEEEDPEDEAVWQRA